jgi:hypothetical protein
MFPSVEGMLRMLETQVRREKAIAARRAAERRNKHERGYMFTWRLRPGAEHRAILALGTIERTSHATCS